MMQVPNIFAQRMGMGNVQPVRGTPMRPVGLPRATLGMPGAPVAASLPARMGAPPILAQQPQNNLRRMLR